MLKLVSVKSDISLAFTDYRNKLNNEAWILRHWLKVVAKSVVDRCYGIHPSPEYLASARTQEDQESRAERYTKKRVAALIDKSSRFLCQSYQLSILYRSVIILYGWVCHHELCMICVSEAIAQCISDKL